MESNQQPDTKNAKTFSQHSGRGGVTSELV